MAKPERKKLKIRCGDSDCNNGLHCFRVTARTVSNFAAGTCQACGADPVDWQRVQQRAPGDVENTFASLGHEFVRTYFMQLPAGEDAQSYARRKGRIGLHAAARKRLKQSIGPAHPFRDGTQTPMLEDSNNPIWNAQHATATCCRRCTEYWHGIARGRALTSGELDYLTGLVTKYLDEKLPDLADEPSAVYRLTKDTGNE
ncbi:MAG: DUF4186 family protein [Opitutaceae bacterium]|nr:DUF4186 family protein [Cephaloticoccus sp.]MCP5530503.1 DUF4186 family protein [Opitutaceae bacterium]